MYQLFRINRETSEETSIGRYSKEADAIQALNEAQDTEPDFSYKRELDLEDSVSYSDEEISDINLGYDAFGNNLRAEDLEQHGRLFIVSARCGVGDDGIACGPVSGPIVAEVKVREEGGGEFFMSLAEVEGIPNFVKTPVSTFDFQKNMNMDPEMLQLIRDNNIQFDDSVYSAVFEHPEYAYYDLYRYLIFLVRAGLDEVDEFLPKEEVNRYLDEIEIPKSDVEEEYEEGAINWD